LRVEVAQGMPVTYCDIERYTIFLLWHVVRKLLRWMMWTDVPKQVEKHKGGSPATKEIQDDDAPMVEVDGESKIW